jgi:aquaporin Z
MYNTLRLCERTGEGAPSPSPILINQEYLKEETMNSSKAFVAEFIGTFVLVFWGSAAVVNAGTTGALIPAFGHGLALMFAAYAMGHWSGAHVNPAVTIAIWIQGAIDAGKAAGYIVVQIVAAISAAAVLNLIMGGNAAGGFGAFSFDISVMSAFLVEMILTFCLATVVLQTAVAGRAGNLAGLAIGLTLAGSILAGGALTGASLNPARTLGPAIIAGQLGQVWVYVAATISGGVLAALVSKFVLNGKEKST